MNKYVFLVNIELRLLLTIKDSGVEYGPYYRIGKIGTKL